MKPQDRSTILFIDDEPSSLTAFKSVFRDFYEIRLATSADEGYRIMQQERIDIVISDQRMPGVTGVEFLQKIRIEFPNTVRMLITGYTDIDTVIQSINGSMISYYFSKPYDERDMKAILDNTVEKIKLMKENRTLMERLQDLVTELTAQKEDLEKEVIRRRAIQDELTIARNKADESSRFKSSLMANLNHEFRTPMNSILGFSEMILYSDTNKDIRDMAGLINISGKRLMKTLNAIADLARFDADPHITIHEKINLSELTKSIAKDFENLATRKGLGLKHHIEEDINTLFLPSFASQIITNLIDNAIKFSNMGTISIFLHKEVKDEKVQAVFKVRDQGIGISTDFRNKIFEDFRQESEGFGRKFEGLGIGLSLAKKILDRVNGVISFESEEGKGTEFTVRFPECSVHGTESDAPSKPQPSLPVQAGATKREEIPIILNIEDNEANQELVSVFLANNYQLEKACDGQTAIRLAREHDFDLLLIDINLGHGIDGVQTLGEIRKIDQYRTVPAIAASGYTSLEDRKKFLSAGFDDCLPKPFTRQSLLSILKKHLGKTEL